jgi:beta-lactamase superfamily II metal-dependent hydrolase
MSPSRSQIRVRMYNVGFGDCFLLSWPGPERTLKILIDCGTHSHGHGPRPIGDVVAQIIKDVTDSDGTPRIDIVVGTHRHQDHVSGFESDLWDDVEVSEVWMPWTEHPTDPEARHVRETQSRSAKRLQLEASTLSIEDPLRDSLLALSANSLTNTRAMDMLHYGFRGKPKRRFLPSKLKSHKSMKPACLPGAIVHILGPSRDPEVIRDMDPPKGRSYLRMAEERDAAKGQPWVPFRPVWKIDMQQMERDKKMVHLIPKRSRDLRTLQNYNELGSRERFDVAVQLEKAVNGTSLVLVFEIGRACLLFPGDAQWGTWRAALEDPEWRNLLARTSFCKVGHHGSHNATPRELLDGALGEGFAAMVSTRSMTAWPDIPRMPLLEKLIEKTGKRVVRSDKPPSKMPVGFHRAKNLYVDVNIPF